MSSKLAGGSGLVPGPHPVRVALLRNWVSRAHNIARRPAFTVGGSLLLAQGVTGVIGLIGARALGPAGKGQITAVLAWAQILFFVFLFGLSFSLSVRTAESRGNELGMVLGNAVAFALTVSVVVGGTASVVLPHALQHLGPDTPRLVRWGMFGGGLTMGADLLASIHMALGRHRMYSLYRLALPLVTAVVIMPLWLAGRLTAGWVLAGFVIGSFTALAVVARGLPWRSITFGLPSLIRDMRYGLKSHVASLVGSMNLRLDLLIMSIFLPAAAVGQYGLANSIMVVLTAAPAAGGMLMLRSVAWASGGDPHAKAAQLGRIRLQARKYLLLSSALGLVLFSSAPLMVHMLLGPSYAPSVRLIQILTPGYIARSYLAITTMGAVGARRPWIGTVSEGVALVVTIALLALLLPRYGATGAALTSTCAYVVAAGVGWKALRWAERRAKDSPNSATGPHGSHEAASRCAGLAG